MTTIKTPSEENLYNFEVVSGEPLVTSSQPFEFFYIDECGNKEEADISSESFELNVYYNGCLYLNSTDIVVEAPNKIYLNISSLDLKEGLYDYVIKIVDNISVISGKIRVYEQ